MKNKIITLSIIIIFSIILLNLDFFSIEAIEIHRTPELPLPKKPFVVSDPAELDQKTKAYLYVAFLIIGVYIITKFT